MDCGQWRRQRRIGASLCERRGLGSPQEKSRCSENLLGGAWAADRLLKPRGPPRNRSSLYESCYILRTQAVWRRRPSPWRILKPEVGCGESGEDPRTPPLVARPAPLRGTTHAKFRPFPVVPQEGFVKVRIALIIPIFFASIALAEIPSKSSRVVDDGSFLNPDAPESGEVLPGCSWYCGEVIPEISASSHLEGNDYIPKKAHDFDFKTAWVEGARGNGKGEFLEYRFELPPNLEKPDDFGVNKLIIINGYRKSEALWKANGRVRTLKMYLNGVETLLIHLSDTFHPQTVEFPHVLLRPGTETVFKFEIVDVYAGSKYQDVAISELLFDGLGVH